MILNCLTAKVALAVSTTHYAAHSLSQQLMAGESIWCWAPTVASDVSSLVTLPTQVGHLAPAQAELARLLCQQSQKQLSGDIISCSVPVPHSFHVRQ